MTDHCVSRCRDTFIFYILQVKIWTCSYTTSNELRLTQDTDGSWDQCTTCDSFRTNFFFVRAIQRRHVYLRMYRYVCLIVIAIHGYATYAVPVYTTRQALDTAIASCIASSAVGACSWSGSLPASAACDAPAATERT